MVWPSTPGYALWLSGTSWSTPHLTDNGTTVSSSEPLAVTGSFTVTGAAVFGSGSASQLKYTSTTIGALPSASGSTCGPSGSASCSGYAFQVSDGTNALDCATGGSSNIHWCYSNGTNWISGANFTALTGDATSTATGGATSVVKVNGGSVPASSNLIGTNSSSQIINEYTSVGAVTWNNSGTCTYAAASAFIAFGTITTVSGQSCTLSPTNLLTGGSYTLKVTNAASTAATLTLGTAGSCSAWKVINGGSGAITLSGSSKTDMLAWTFDGTNCILTFGTNFS